MGDSFSTQPSNLKQEVSFYRFFHSNDNKLLMQHEDYNQRAREKLFTRQKEVFLLTHGKVDGWKFLTKNVPYISFPRTEKKDIFSNPDLQDYDCEHRFNNF